MWSRPLRTDGMGNRNHLHVCQHCGIVHATASSTGPERCVVCDAFTFSEYELNGLLDDANEHEVTTSAEGDDGRARAVSIARRS